MKSPLFLFSIFSGAVCCASLRSLASELPHGFSMLNVLNTYSRHNSFMHQQSRAISMRASRGSSPIGDNSNEINAKGQKHKALAPNYTPKTPHQRAYCNCLTNPNATVVFGIGPAGTGKTLFACITAIQMLRRGEIQKIILTRPVVSVEEDLGFLPGNMVMKMDPWTRPIFDIFLEFYAQKDVDAMVQSGTIEISPLAYMRGRTFKRAFIIADEMQNSSPNQMLMLITRIGDRSKMVITGDLKQSDRFAGNGLQDILSKLHRQRGNVGSSPSPSSSRSCGVECTTNHVYSIGGIHAVEFTDNDIERSDIVKQVLALYDSPPSVIPIQVAASSPSHKNTTISAIATATAHNVSELVIAIQDANITDTTATTLPVLESPSQYELVSRDDAALIPKQHTSTKNTRRIIGEQYGNFSSGKWNGW